MNMLKKTPAHFTNKQNHVFYTVNPFQHLTETSVTNAGLLSNIDLEKIKNIIVKNNSFLEIGAGHGRIIDFILRINPKAIIYAYENNPSYYAYLKNKYKNHHNIFLLNKNILTSKTIPKTDITLLMFSVLSEFNPLEQQKLLQKLTKTTQRKIVIDVPKYTSKINGVWKNKYTAYVLSPNMNMETFTPDKELLERYLTKTHFNITAIKKYKTPTDRERLCYILSYTANR